MGYSCDATTFFGYEVSVDLIMDYLAINDEKKYDLNDSEDRYELTTNVAHLLNEKSLDLKFEDFTGYQDYGHFETDNFFFAICIWSNEIDMWGHSAHGCLTICKPFEEILGVVDSKKEYVASFMSLIGQEDYSLKCFTQIHGS